MLRTNLKILALSIVVLGFYTLIASVIPQLQSEVPETLDLSAGVTPEMLVEAGERLYNGAGACTSCHGLGERAPNLLTDHAGEGVIGARCGGRKPGMDCKAYLYESLTQPAAHLVEGFPAIMPPANNALTEDQLWALVAYLQGQGGEVTVTAADIQVAPTAPGGTAPAAGGAGGFSDVTDPMQLLTVNACIGCHGIDGTEIPIGPSFDGIGSRLTADEIRTSILDPAAVASEGYEAFANLMPPTFGTQLSAAQLEILVTFLAQRR